MNKSAAANRKERGDGYLPYRSQAKLSDSQRLMNLTPARQEVREWWRVPQYDLSAVLHRLEVAPWYADHGVAVSDPFPELSLLEVRSEIASRKVSTEKRKNAARQQTRRAIADGLLSRSFTCGDCGTTEAVECHHPDYSTPLDVEWLCRRCHTSRHVQQRRAA